MLRSPATPFGMRGDLWPVCQVNHRDADPRKITLSSIARLGLLLQRHPDQIDGINADVSRLVAFANVDCGHPTDFTIGRRIGVRVLGLLLRSRGPLTPLDVNIEHVRMMSMHALPLAGIHGETLNDDQIILKQVLSRDVRVVKVVVLSVPPRSCRWRFRCDRLESHPDHLYRCDPRVGAALIDGIASVLPHHASVSPEGRPSGRAGCQHAPLDEDRELVTGVRMTASRLAGLDNELLDNYPRIVQQHLAVQIGVSRPVYG